MPMRKVVLLLVALMIAGGTFVLSRGMIAGKGQPVAVETKITQTQEVLVAARDLPAGTLLKDVDLKWQSWPKEEGIVGYAIKGQKDIKDFAGTVVRYGMRAGEPVMAGRTVKPGEQGFMAAALAPGMRAASIAITPVAGVAGFVFPGDHVDVIVTHQIGRKNSDMGSGEQRRVSETMLKNVRVLALDQKMNDQVSEPKVAQIATLEVSPKQAETLALISELGTISLALRSIANDPDEEPAKAEPTQATLDPTTPNVVIDAAALATKPPSLETITWDSDISKVLPRPANRAGAVQKIQIIRGKETSESIFDLQQE